MDTAQVALHSVATVEAARRTCAHSDAARTEPGAGVRSARNGRGPWWNAGASHMNAAFPKSWFDRMGLVSLLDTVQRLQRVS